MQFTLMYEMRNPPWTERPIEKFYSQALDQITWADQHGFSAVSCPEHHGESDGYMPDPISWACAIAAQTTRIRIDIGVVVLSLHHPVEIAERFALLDILSKGRATFTVAGGYRTSDFEMYGIEYKTRPGRMTEALQIIKKCWEEECFDWDGKYWNLKNVRAMPKPYTKPRPKITMGGNSEGAARRAARHADGFRNTNAGWYQYYQDELRKLGKNPGPERVEVQRSTFGTWVAKDPIREWERIKQYCHHDWVQYSTFHQFQDQREVNPFFRPISDPDELRSSGLWMILTPDEAVELLKRREREEGVSAVFQTRPAIGGSPLEIGQECLELITHEVMPHFTAVTAKSIG